MCREITPQDALRNNITYNLFVDTADQNYVVARWCYQQGLALDFLWNAAHCLEKFMKAALLLNGRSAKRSAPGEPSYGHDLNLLYTELSDLAAALLPDMLIKPNEISMHWRVETAEQYIQRISDGGDAHNRYQIYGYSLHSEDLYKLDRMVYSIRRLCCPLDKYLFGNVRHGQPARTFREILESDLDYMPHKNGSRWQKLTQQKAPEQVRFAALNHNVLFAEDDFEHGTLQTGSSSLNPVLGRRILLADEQGATGERAAETVELIDWVTENIFLPREVRTQLLEVRGRLAARVSDDGESAASTTPPA